MLQISEELKNYYKNSEKVIRRIMSEKGLSIEKGNFINLTIVKKEEQHNSEIKNLNINPLEKSKINHRYEDVFSSEKKEIISVDKIFSSNSAKSILIFGRSGIGKSTLTQYISYQWAEHELWSHIKFIFKIRLRNLNKKTSTKSLPNIIAQECFDSSIYDDKDITNIAKAIKTILKEKSSEMLIILDGYDEFDQIKSPCRETIRDLLNKKADFYLIMTSRPYVKNLCFDFDLQLECIGFTAQNIKQYIKLEEIGINNKTQLEIYNFLNKNINVYNLMHIPIMLDILCAIWGKGINMEKGNITITEFYTKLIQKLWEAFDNKQAEIDPNIKDASYREKKNKAKEFLKLLAFRAMETRNIMLDAKLVCNVVKEIKEKYGEVCDKDDVKRCIHDILSPGLLCSPNYTENNYDECDYYFSHLSIQEYFAAQYLIEYKFGYILTLRNNPLWIDVLRYAAGILAFDKNHNEKLKVFYNLLRNDNNEEIMTFYELCLLLRCFEESLINSEAEGISQFKLLSNALHRWINKLYEIEDKRPKNIHIMDQKPLWTPIFKHFFYCLKKSKTFDILLANANEVNNAIENRVFSIDLLIEISGIDEVALPIILNLTKNERLRSVIIKALGHLRQPSKEIVNKLLRIFSDGSEDLFYRINAGESLKHLTLQSEYALKILLKYLNDITLDEKYYITITQIGADTLIDLLEYADYDIKEIFEYIICIIDHEDNSIKVTALKILSKLNKISVEILQKLIFILSNEDDNLSEEAMELLINYYKIDNEATLSTLFKGLNTQVPAIWEKVLDILLVLLKEEDLLNKLYDYLTRDDLLILIKENILDIFLNFLENEENIECEKNNTSKKIYELLYSESLLFHMKSNIAACLSKFYQKDEKIISILCESLNHEDDWIKFNSACSLIYLGEEQTLSKSILETLCKKDEYELSAHATMKLIALENGNEKYLKILHDIFNGNFDKKKETLTKLRLKKHEQDEFYNKRIYPENAELYEKEIEALENYLMEDNEISMDAADILFKADLGFDLIYDWLMLAFVDNEMHEYAVEFLTQLIKKSNLSDLPNLLLKLINENQSPCFAYDHYSAHCIRSGIEEAISNCIKENKEILDIFFQLLSSEMSEIKYAVLDIIKAISHDFIFQVDKLIEMLSYDDLHLVGKVLNILSSLIYSDKVIKEKLIQILVVKKLSIEKITEVALILSRNYFILSPEEFSLLMQHCPSEFLEEICEQIVNFALYRIKPDFILEDEALIYSDPPGFKYASSYFQDNIKPLETLREKFIELVGFDLLFWYLPLDNVKNEQRLAETVCNKNNYSKALPLKRKGSNLESEKNKKSKTNNGSPSRDDMDILLANSLNTSALESQRSLCSVKINAQDKACYVIPTQTDGDCGLSAVHLSLMAQGHPEMAAYFNRKSFIDLVCQINTEPSYQAYQDYITAIYQAAKKDNSESWAQVFQFQGYWLEECHFRFLSAYFNIKFEFYTTGEHQFIPELTYESIFEGNIDKPIITVSLAHVSTQLLDRPDATLNHFDALIIEQSLNLQNSPENIHNLPDPSYSSAILISDFGMLNDANSGQKEVTEKPTIIIESVARRIN